MDDGSKENLADAMAAILEDIRERKWPAFSEAAAEMGRPPWRAVAELLVRVVEESLGDADGDEDDEFTEEKLRSFLLSAYLAHAAGELPKTSALRLAHLVDQAGLEESWREMVAEEHRIDEQFVRDLYALLRTRMAKPAALIFINRGLTNPRPVDSLLEAVGDRLFEDG